MKPDTRARWKAYWTRRGVIPRWQQFGAYVLIVAAGAIGFHNIGNAAEKANRATRESRALALSAKRQSAKTAALARTIQRQRREFCKDQNDRHDATIRELDVQIQKLIKAGVITKSELAQVKASKAANIALINALAPRHRCAKITSP